MMLKRYVEMPADIRKFRWIHAPDSACQFHRTEERLGRLAQAIGSATRVQYPLVKRCIVSCKKIGICCQGLQGRPQFVKGGSIVNIFPRYAMKIREDELPVRRTEQVVFPADNATAFYNHESDCASAVRAVIRSLKINGGKCRHGRVD